MSKSKVFVKLLSPEAKLPTRKDGDAGWDLYSIEDITINGGEYKTIKTGISIQMPKGWVGCIWPRSGLSVKQGADVLAGVVDSTYTGEIMVCLSNNTTPLPLFETPGDVAIHISKGDRIAQILFHELPDVELIEVDRLDETERGEKGFGSSGK